MSETFVWPEGSIHVWTGSATASAVIVYAQAIQGTFTRGWDNFPVLDGTWRDVLTGERADITFNMLYCTNNSAIRTFDAAKTGVHMHLRHTALDASAGVLLYSGRIDMLQLAGSERQSFQNGVTYHANVWSAYG